MKTIKQKRNMETSMNQSMYICGCCKRKLLPEAFYINRRTQTADNYCKECRKANARKHRNRKKSISFKNKPLSYPVITEVKDDTLRMFLIHQALRVVAKSIRQKQEKEKLRALWEE